MPKKCVPVFSYMVVCAALYLLSYIFAGLDLCSKVDFDGHVRYESRAYYYGAFKLICY